MTDRPYRFVRVQECKVGDLLRVTVKLNTTDWAIVAESKRLVLLTGERGPRSISMVRNGGQLLEGLVAHHPLNYGRSYTILPTHDGPCDLGQGPLFKTAGALVLKDTDLLLHAPSEAPEGAGYLDLTTFKLQGEPGGARAAFGEWTLWYDALPAHQPSTRLFTYSANATSE
jgi:hypothetical protein